MGFFDISHRADINEGVWGFRRTAGAVLIDVRTAEEYRGERIPGSRNIPPQSLDKVGTLIDNRDVPLFVYCCSGAGSRQAEAILRSMGHSKARNLGGIAAYTGKVEI